MISALIALTVACWMLPASTIAAVSSLDADLRTIPLPTIRRLALEGGFFPPATWPVSEGELADLLDKVLERAYDGQAPAFLNDDELYRLRWLLDRYRRGGSGRSYRGCTCKVYPPVIRVGGRVVTGHAGLGRPLTGEAGLPFGAGTFTSLEPVVDLAAGPWWAAVAGRWQGRVLAGGEDFAFPGGDADPLTWPGWSPATGMAQVRRARLRGGRWSWDFPRAVGGVRVGRWALSLGWDSRRTGPGLSGGLNLNDTGRPFPALTARRTAPYAWRGVMAPLAPHDLLLRVGLLSPQRVSYGTTRGSVFRHDNPWYMQWLMGWEVFPWFRFAATQSVLAVPREGTLWPDLLQVNFPLIGTTWREKESGPLTDRIFSVQFVFRWRRAPWPLLPSAAGRLYWNYGGTDYLPSGPGGLFPEISIPASVAGIALLDPRWDLAFEYTELQHDKVLWYTNGGYPEGHTHEGWLIGNPLGGSAESTRGRIQVRPAGLGADIALQTVRTTWGMRGHTPGTGRRVSWGLSVTRSPRLEGQPRAAGPGSPLLWSVTCQWNREEADRGAFGDAPDPSLQASRDYWRIICRLGF